MQYRDKLPLISGFFLACFAAAGGHVAYGAQALDPQKLAVVNVSLVFEKYAKVADVQKRIDATHEARRKELDLRGKAIAESNRRLSEEYKTNGQSEQIFDLVQRLRKEQFVYERDINQLNDQIQKDYTREMREVLSDIRQGIKSYAEAEGFDMVLRSPDADNPEVLSPSPDKLKDPAAADKQTYLQTQDPKTVAEVLERFNRNPVLFGAKTVDITDEVLKRLNGQFMKRSISGQK